MTLTPAKQERDRRATIMAVAAELREVVTRSVQLAVTDLLVRFLLGT